MISLWQLRADWATPYLILLLITFKPTSFCPSGNESLHHTRLIRKFGRSWKECVAFFITNDSTPRISRSLHESIKVRPNPNECLIQSLYQKLVSVVMIKPRHFNVTIKLLRTIKRIENEIRCAVIMCPSDSSSFKKKIPNNHLRPGLALYVTDYSRTSEVSWSSFPQKERKRINKKEFYKEFTRFKGIFSKRRRISKMNITVALLEYHPFVYKTKDGYDGIDIKIIKAAAETLGFSYHFVSPEDNEWGWISANGSWTGMIRMLLTKKADVAIGAVAASLDRRKVVDFTNVYFRDETTFATAVPRYTIHWTAIIQPFPSILWLLTFVSLVFTALFLFLLIRLSRERRLEFFELIFMCLSIICNQTAFRVPENTVCRIVLGTWMVCCVIILAAYSGILTSFLANPPLDKPIQTVEELLARPNMKWGKKYLGGVAEHSFKTSQNPKQQLLWKQMIFQDSFHSCLERAIEGNFVCFEDLSGLSSLLKDINSKPGGPFLLMAKEKIFSYQTAIAIPKRSPLKHSLDKILQILSDSGMIARWTEKYFSESYRVLKFEVVENPIFSLTHMASAFYFLGIGSIVSIISFMLGLISYRLEQVPKQIKRKASVKITEMHELKNDM